MFLSSATMKLMHPNRKQFMQAKVVRQFHERAQVAAKLSPADCPSDACAVLDPLDHRNNLARSVSPDALFRMQKAFERGSVALADTLSDANLGYSFAEHFFKRSYEQLRLGSGDHWRHDHVVHPRQNVVGAHVTEANLLPRPELFESESMPLFASPATDKKPGGNTKRRTNSRSKHNK